MTDPAPASRATTEGVSGEATEEVGAPGRLLWLLRHAKAAADPPRSGTDHERPLAPRGRRDALALGQRLATDGLGFRPGELPTVALCSTASRTIETADRVAGAIGAAVDRRRRLYYGSPTDMLDEARTLDEATGSVLMVGHNPAIHSLALLVFAPSDAHGHSTLEGRGFPTCALAVFRLPAARWTDVAGGTGTLAGFFTPPY